MNADGTNQIRLSTYPGPDHQPAFSPDGTRIAFTSRRDGNTEIYQMDADGSEQTRLTTDPAIDGEPDWGVHEVPNQRPSVAVVAGGSCDPVGQAGTVALAVGDPDTDPDQLRVTATSSNHWLLPDSRLNVGGKGTTRTLTAAPIPARSGRATVRIAVDDGARRSTTRLVVVAGTHRFDQLNGAAGADLLLGEGGADVVNGAAGIDLLCGGAGDDALRGGTGSDTLGARAGSDNLSGGFGSDALRGARGSDTLNGRAGDDSLEGGGAADLLRGGPGADFFSGGPGRDTNDGFDRAEGDTTDRT